MADLEDVARLVSLLPQTSVGERRGQSAWSVAGACFAWERPFSKADVKRFGADPVPSGPILALVTDGLEDKESLLQSHPGHLFTIPHFAGYPAVLLHLNAAGEDELRESLLDAWLVHAPADVARAHLDALGDGRQGAAGLGPPDVAGWIERTGRSGGRALRS